jgi:hypothetical protein
MKRLFLSENKAIILQTADDIEFKRVEYPLSIVVTANVRDPQLSFAQIGSALRSALSVCRWKIRLARIESALANYVPTETQLRRFADWLINAADVAEMVLKVAVIACVTYLFIEVGLAFLPGGPAHRLIGGGQ